MTVMEPGYPFGLQAAHIAIVMHDFSTGGSERIAIRLANQWARAGRKVTILCGVSQGPARALVDPMIDVIGVWPEIPRSWMSRLALGSALADCIALLRPDIVFAPGNFHIPVIGTLARMMGADRPVTVCKLSNPLRRPGRLSLFQGLFEALIRRFAGSIDSFVAMSTALAEEAQTVLRPPSVRRIYEPNIDPSLSWSGRRLTPRERTIVCAGRLVRQKNFALAIEAFARLDRAMAVRLRIFGEGEERIALEKMVDRLGLNDRVSFEGYVPDIRPFLGQASLFLLSSRFEGYPAVLIEALCAGVPVVTTDCSPALAEIMIDPAFGRVVPATAEAIGGALSAMLEDRSAQLDPTMLLDRHRADAVAQDYLDLFDELVGARHQRKCASPI